MVNNSVYICNFVSTAANYVMKSRLLWPVMFQDVPSWKLKSCKKLIFLLQHINTIQCIYYFWVSREVKVTYVFTAFVFIARAYYLALIWYMHTAQNKSRNQSTERETVIRPYTYGNDTTPHFRYTNNIISIECHDRSSHITKCNYV